MVDGVNIPGVPGLPVGIPAGVPIATPVAAPAGVPAVAPQINDQGIVAGDDWGNADINNPNLDEAELRALDNLMQTYLVDGALSGAEATTYTEIRKIFESTAGSVSHPPTGTGPVGGSAPILPASLPTPAPAPAWPVGTEPANGRTFKSWGDPHEVSGDGAKFDNEKVGTFVKLKSASGDFELQTTQGKDPSGRWPNATLNHRAAVRSGKDVVAYDGLAKTLTINGKAVDVNSLPQNLPGGGKVTKTADGISITSAKGDVVNVHQKDQYIDISGEVSTDRKDGEIRGSLGAMDADTVAGNELLGRTGTEQIGKPGDAASIDKFLETWRVQEGESLFPTDVTGGGGKQEDPFDADVRAEFAARDKTANGYLSGNELPADYPNPLGAKVTFEAFLKWRKDQEALALAGDKAAFKARDINGDAQLDGNEVGDAAGFDQGGNFVRPDGTNQIEISDIEFMAGRAAARRTARWADLGGVPATPVGGGAQPVPGAPVGGGAGAETPGAMGLKVDLSDDDKQLALRRARWQGRLARFSLVRFLRLDLNHDGFLTGKWHVKAFDQNGDGKVSLREFMKGRAERRAERAFARLDRNKDGVLTGTNTYARVKRFDADNDGKVSKAEFVAGRLAESAAARARAIQINRTNGDDRLPGVGQFVVKPPDTAQAK